MCEPDGWQHVDDDGLDGMWHDGRQHDGRQLEALPQSLLQLLLLIPREIAIRADAWWCCRREQHPLKERLLQVPATYSTGGVRVISLGQRPQV